MPRYERSCRRVARSLLEAVTKAADEIRDTQWMRFRIDMVGLRRATQYRNAATSDGL